MTATLRHLRRHHHRHHREPPVALLVAGLFVAALWLVASAGCQRYHDYGAFVRHPKPLASDKAYIIEPPDELMVTSRRVREIGSHMERVRPDGLITLPLLGPVYVAGKTPEELREEITQLASKYYEDADINVKVTGFASKKVFVFGEVGIPGPYPYTGANTVLGTLSRAQPSRLADPSRIHVLRPSPDGELVHRMTVDLDMMVRTGDTMLDAPLEEGDIIFVPPSGLASVGLALQTLLLPIQPATSVVQAPPNIYDAGQQQPYKSDGTN